MLISIFLEFDIFCNKKREKKSSLLSIKIYLIIQTDVKFALPVPPSF
jgi:hypothetical protein